MRDLHNWHKVKNIAERKQDLKKKVFKTKSDLLSIINRIRE